MTLRALFDRVHSTHFHPWWCSPPPRPLGADIMGSVFRKTTTRPLPPGAEVGTKGGVRVARWKVRGKPRTAPLTTGADGADRISTRAATYTAKYRDHDGRVVERPTGCKDEQAARQMLAGWEREVERVRAGTLDPGELDTARRAAAPVAEHLAAHEQALVAGDTSAGYRANVRRAVTRLAAECGFVSLADLARGPVERWLAARVGDGMSARTRNYYRESLIAFANWCVAGGRLRDHDFDRLPKADKKADPRRQRRALTEGELSRLLAVVAARPLAEARTIRRGRRKGEQVAKLSDGLVERLNRVGRERALIVKTLVLTGLRANELRTLAVGQLDLTPGGECLHLDAADEKSREGNTVALRGDLAADLRAWLGHTSCTEPTAPLFVVPAGFLRILDRDLKAAGIPKRDDRGRTVDVHALRTTFGTLLSKAGVSPRTAQQAMRHSDIKLTMGVYTDPRLLDTRGAVEKLPTLPVQNSVAPPVAPTPFSSGQSGSAGGKSERACGGTDPDQQVGGSGLKGNGNAPVTTGVITGASVGLTGFEPATSWSRRNPSHVTKRIDSTGIPGILPRRAYSARRNNRCEEPYGVAVVPRSIAVMRGTASHPRGGCAYLQAEKPCARRGIGLAISRTSGGEVTRPSP
jgi:integrase